MLYPLAPLPARSLRVATQAAMCSFAPIWATTYGQAFGRASILHLLLTAKPLEQTVLLTLLSEEAICKFSHKIYFSRKEPGCVVKLYLQFYTLLPGLLTGPELK